MAIDELASGDMDNVRDTYELTRGGYSSTSRYVWTFLSKLLRSHHLLAVTRSTFDKDLTISELNV